MVARKTTGKRSSYGAEIDGLLADYCAALHGVAERNVVRDAIRHFIEFQLSENAGIQKRFNELRAKRLSEERPGIHIVKPEVS